MCSELPYNVFSSPAAIGLFLEFANRITESNQSSHPSDSKVALKRKAAETNLCAHLTVMIRETSKLDSEHKTQKLT